MRFRIALITLFASVFAGLLSACNFTLAQDVTPPPGYVPPTPMPTLVLVPPQTPNVANGAAIYAVKCAPCHGETGLGDGKQGLQLGVTVKAFGLPEIARPASPEEYYTTVTRGNMERLMPPFNSLNDQERWDVVAYVLTLHTTPEQVEQGKKLFEANCADCSTDFFRDQEQMTKLSAVELARLVRQGNNEVPALGANLSDDDLWAIAAYLRTLSFDTAPLAQPTTVPASETPVAAVAETPSGEGTPVGSEVTSVMAAGFGNVRGTVESKSGASLPTDVTVTLHGFEHAKGENAGAQEVVTQEGKVNADGTYVFENVEMPAGRIFLVEATYSNIALQSEPGVVEAGQTELGLPPILLYEITDDSSKLVIDEVSIFFHAGEESTYDVLVLYNFRNPGDEVIAVKMKAQQEIPFLKFPKDATGLSYEAVQDSAPFISMDDGFAMRPSEQPYGIVAYSTVPKQSELTITQDFILPVALVRIYVPDGMEVKGENLASEETQNIQGTVYRSYKAPGLQAGEGLTFEVSGTPSGAGAEATQGTSSSNNLVLIGAGGLGILLIGAGVWMYARDRKRTEDELEEEDDEDEPEFAASEEVLDAIIALDDLHRAKKISDEAYQKRRAELKETLKEMM
ncbi:MAG TPA: c-type cytochrome [Anaerolineales bacterium]|nr:c-type cytochrome [Anaerolineales bacterium]